MREYTHLSLFSGIGGLDLAAEWAGFKTVGQCEWADYPTKVLEKHWPGVPRWRDIRTLTKESFYEQTGLRTVDIVSGGFPCQPFSVAGKHGGKDDDRYLWPEMLRVIRELQPSWAIGENVTGIINMALDTVLSDLENEGYATQAFVVPACGVDAPHRRNRVCILANHTGERDGKYRASNDAAKTSAERFDNTGRKAANDSRELRENQSRICGMADGLRAAIHETDSNADSNRLQGRPYDQIYFGGGVQACSERISGMHSPWENWPDEPGVDRVVDGIPHRMDRVKCLGNAVVPQQFYPFFMAIRDEIRKEAKDNE